MSSVRPGPIERGSELRRLSDQLDDACDGRGSLVVVEGPAGIGKTTLIREAMKEAEARGMTVIYGRGAALEQHAVPPC